MPGAAGSANDAGEEPAADLLVVVPVLNEAASLAGHLQALKSLRERGARVVVADGGSTDSSPEIARWMVDGVVSTGRGRARQMNAGALACPAQVLLFLHADTSLPNGADRLILDAVASGRAWGRFDVHINSTRRALRVVGTLMNFRSRLTGMATGDQALFMTSAAFLAVGGFPVLPLMEDIEMSRRLKRIGRPDCLRQRVATSARRWERGGIWRTVWLMWCLRAAYFFGVDPERLALRYGHERPESG